MEDTPPVANKLHQLQQALGQAQGLGVGGSSGSGSGSGSPKKRSMLDAPLSTPRGPRGKGGAAAARNNSNSAGPRKGGGNNGSGSKKPRNGNNGSGSKKPRNGNRPKNGSGGGKSNRGGQSDSNKNAASSGVNSDRPPPIVCSAFATLASRIRQRPPSSLEDLAKEQIGDLSCVPYTYTYGIDTPTASAASASTGGTANDKRIVVITDAAGSQSSVASIRAELQQQQQQQQSAFQFLGFDVETKPKFHKGPPNPVALIQLATQTTAYLFRVKFQEMRAHGGGAGTGASSGAWTPELRHLLSDATIIKVGVGIHNDVRTLQDTYGAQVCGDATSYLDLTELVKIKWPLIRRCGLRNLAATVLGWRLSKAQQMKNWEVKEMTNAMMEYAAADAFVALDLLEAIVT